MSVVPDDTGAKMTLKPDGHESTLRIGTERLTLQGVGPASARDLHLGGDGGFEWVDGGPFEGTRRASGMVLKAYEAGAHRPEWGVYVLVRREDGRAVGAMGFHGPPDEHGRAEVGYDLAETARGNGYATEALRALSAWALARDDVRQLIATIARDNLPSQRVVTRAGFVPMGEDAETAVARGRERGEDLVAYELRGTQDHDGSV